jgi:hypothetical protein
MEVSAATISSIVLLESIREEARMVADVFRAGAAAVNVDPPIGLPMVGVVRRTGAAEERIGHLEVTAAAFERDSIRVVLCGVDSCGIQSPEVDVLRDRIADATGASARASCSTGTTPTRHRWAGRCSRRSMR